MEMILLGSTISLNEIFATFIYMFVVQPENLYLNFIVLDASSRKCSYNEMHWHTSFCSVNQKNYVVALEEHNTNGDQSLKWDK